MKYSSWSRIVVITLGVALAFASHDRGARALDEIADPPQDATAEISSATGDNRDDARDERPSRSWFRDWGRPSGPPNSDGGPGLRRGPGPGDGFYLGPPPPYWSVERLEELRRVNPELADIHVELRQVELDLQRMTERIPDLSNPNVRNRVESRLRSLLERQFELNLKRQRMEIEFMEKRLESLKEMVAQLEQHQDRILERRLRGLLAGEPSGFGGRRGGPPQREEDVDTREPRSFRPPSNGSESPPDGSED